VTRDANFSKDGPFQFAHDVIENVRRGLIDRYGQDPEYIKAARGARAYEGGKLHELTGVLKALNRAGVGTPEARVLHGILTGEDIKDADMAKLAMPIRQSIDEMGAEAVSLGLISAESYERNRGTYLHRVYMMHEAEQSRSFSGWVSKQMSARRAKFSADEMEGRGTFWDIPHEKLGGAPEVGDKFHVVDKLDKNGETSRSRSMPSRAAPGRWARSRRRVPAASLSPGTAGRLAPTGGRAPVPRSIRRRSPSCPCPPA
jgi:hypothetical protein